MSYFSFMLDNHSCELIYSSFILISVLPHYMASCELVKLSRILLHLQQELTSSQLLLQRRKNAFEPT